MPQRSQRDDAGCQTKAEGYGSLGNRTSQGSLTTSLGSKNILLKIPSMPFLSEAKGIGVTDGSFQGPFALKKARIKLFFSSVNICPRIGTRATTLSTVWRG